MGWEAKWALEVLAGDPLLGCVPVLGTSCASRSPGLGWDPPALHCVGGKDAVMKVKAGTGGQWACLQGLLWLLSTRSSFSLPR